MPEPFLPQPVFAVEDADPPSVPRALISPHRYIQGPGVIDHLGRYLSLVPSRRAAVLISDGGQKRFGARVGDSLKQNGVEAVTVIFDGECSVAEVDRVAGELASKDVDAVIAVGGGKCLDAGKCVAHRVSVPAVSCPTLASTDAPCSAVSVMYTEEGVLEAVEFFPSNPAIVVVDTRIVADAPVRFLVAGIGDALATWYEARTCFRNPAARSAFGSRITIAATTIAELCADTVREYGMAAVESVRKGVIDEGVERVVEANTLLSGVGFESGGLAVKAHHDALHGELVSIGILTQLALEDDLDEAREAAAFLADIGLPVHLGQISIDLERDAEGLRAAMEGAASFPFVANEPFEVTPESLFDALSRAHALGVEVTASKGDEAYRALRAA
ncbi:MAG: glycerol dehydrogenase [Gemmatimonadota bacterium]